MLIHATSYLLYLAGLIYFFIDNFTGDLQKTEFLIS